MTAASILSIFFVSIGGFLNGFPLIWCFVIWLLSHFSGWQRLAKRYAAGDRPVSGEKHSGFQALIGGARYRQVITVHFNHDGFFMEANPFFKLGHPRLFIPWLDVHSRTPCLMRGWKAERLSIGEPVIGTITLPVLLLNSSPTRK
ncbi:MAG: hypothetical protein KA152_02935 [Verrucomicrobiales bacterium]|nr:hypothetical protein [Verrucomicrobiales bacterium]